MYVHLPIKKFNSKSMRFVQFVIATMLSRCCKLVSVTTFHLLIHNFYPFKLLLIKGHINSSRSLPGLDRRCICRRSLQIMCDYSDRQSVLVWLISVIWAIHGWRVQWRVLRKMRTKSRRYFVTHMVKPRHNRSMPWVHIELHLTKMVGDAVYLLTATCRYQLDVQSMLKV